MALRIALVSLAWLPAVLAVLAGPALADDCAAPLAAQTLTAKTPHKLTATQTAKGATRTTSLIQTADKIYLQVNGKWRVSPRTPAQAASDAADVVKETKYTCKAMGSETVNGEAADVYQIHSVDGDLSNDNKVWISKSKKMTIKTEAKAISNVYDYANVQAPGLN